MLRFKVHCSSIGDIMTNPKLKSETLSATAKGVAVKWMKEQIYNRKHHFKSKYTDKGIDCEDESIIFVNKHYGYNAVKNTQTKSNDFLIGTADIVLPDLVIDIKNSWSDATFPLFSSSIPDKSYEWQVQGYAELYGVENLSVIYTLMDAPGYLIDKEAYYKSKELQLDEVDAELYEHIKEQMTYSNFKDNIRIKRFDFKKDQEKINQIKERVQLINDWIENETNFKQLIK